MNKDEKLSECPYYKYHCNTGKSLSIGCEGGKLKFPEEQARTEWAINHCNTGKDCPIHKMLEEYYYERKYKGFGNTP